MKFLGTFLTMTMTHNAELSDAIFSVVYEWEELNKKETS